jgi:hypothetical protein
MANRSLSNGFIRLSPIPLEPLFDLSQWRVSAIVSCLDLFFGAALCANNKGGTYVDGDASFSI